MYKDCDEKGMERETEPVREAYEFDTNLTAVSPAPEYKFHMANEFETVRSAVPTTVIEQSSTGGEPYYKETIKQKKEKKGGFKKYVAVAVTCALIGAPLLGLGMGAGQTLAENYLYKNSEISETSDTVKTAETNEAANNASEYTQTLKVSDTVNGNSVSEAFKSAQASVVSITTKIVSQNQMYNFYFGGSREKEGSGSGIVIKEDDINVYIMTNYHVIESANKAYVSFIDQEQISARLVGADKESDVAVISVKKADLVEEGITDIVVARFSDSDILQVGDSVVAIGNAIGNGKTATYGIVSALNKEIDFEDGKKPLSLIQTDAAINPGNSGGALVNMSGEIIGMNVAKIAEYSVEGMGFAIPINYIAPIIDSIVNDTSTAAERPYIGISGATIDQDMVEQYSLIVNEGVIIIQVDEGSGASFAGLKSSDIIVEFNGTKITTMEQLQKMVASMGVGSQANAKIIRDNIKEIDVLIDIMDRSEVGSW